jgi:hypothetical protein
MLELAGSRVAHGLIDRMHMRIAVNDEDRLHEVRGEAGELRAKRSIAVTRRAGGTAVEMWIAVEEQNERPVKRRTGKCESLLEPRRIGMCALAVLGAAFRVATDVVLLPGTLSVTNTTPAATQRVFSRYAAKRGSGDCRSSGYFSHSEKPIDSRWPRRLTH